MTSPVHAPAESADELLALLTLRFTPQLGPRRIESLRRHLGSARQVLTASLSDLRGVPGLEVKSVAAIGTTKAAELASAEMGKAAEAGVTLLGRGLPGYPDALEALGDPPPVLWVLGKLPEFPAVPRAIGIVGTRAASPHALQLTRTVAGDLTRADVVVVSGLARGIDTAAHTATVEAGGVTVGVLGSGVNHIYPGENVPLSRRMTVISEYPLGTPPAQHHFPTRNRLIAALSTGSLVVEGELKSGSMITATHALECGRTVFAVPGRAGDPRAAGPHRLIREGAVLTESAQDILDELGWGAAPTQPLPTLPPDQARVYAALSAPLTLDDLQAATGLTLPELQTALLMLNLQSLAEETGGRWARR